MSTLFRFELALAFALSAWVVWMIFATPSCLLACPMYVGPPGLPMPSLVALGLLALGWAWIAWLFYGVRRR